MLFCCPWLPEAGSFHLCCQPGRSKAVCCASIYQPGSCKGCTVAIASMHDASIFMCAGFTWHLSDAVKKNTRFTRGFRGFRRGAEPPKATQKPPKKEWL